MIEIAAKELSGILAPLAKGRVRKYDHGVGVLVYGDVYDRVLEFRLFRQPRGFRKKPETLAVAAAPVARVEDCVATVTAWRFCSLVKELGRESPTDVLGIEQDSGGGIVLTARGGRRRFRLFETVTAVIDIPACVDEAQARHGEIDALVRGLKFCRAAIQPKTSSGLFLDDEGEILQVYGKAVGDWIVYRSLRPDEPGYTVGQISSGLCAFKGTQKECRIIAARLHAAGNEDAALALGRAIAWQRDPYASAVVPAGAGDNRD